MSRPLKQGVDYFSHDTKISGKTIFTLEQIYGNDGYAFWFKLLEILGEQSGLFYDCSNTANWLYLISKMKITAEKTEEIMKLLVDLEAIDGELWTKKRIIWCQNFANRLTPLFLKRKEKTPNKPSLRSGNPSKQEFTERKPEQNDIKPAETPQSKVKESKVKKSKVNTLCVRKGVVGGKPPTAAIATVSRSEVQKHKFGKFKNVLLTQAEYDRLLAETDGAAAIEYYSENRKIKGYKAKDDNLAIRKWAFIAVAEQRQRKARIEQNKYAPPTSNPFLNAMLKGGVK